MKIKFYYIVISLIVLISVSCSKDDTEKTDAIVGQWEYVKHYINGEEFVYPNCSPTKSQYTNNGRIIQTEYLTNPSGECEANTSSVLTWQKSGENGYTITNQTYGYTYFFTGTFENNGTILNFISTTFDTTTGMFQETRYVYRKIY